MVPKLEGRSVKCLENFGGERLPKGCLDASDVILSPVSLSNFLLTNWYTAPGNSHNGNIIDVILIEGDFKTREVTIWPLIQSPALDDLSGFLEFEIFARDVAAKELELATLLCAFKELWCCARESCDAFRVSEGFVELGSGSTELFGVGHGGGVD